MFEGLKVLEVATGLAGPVVTSWLGGLGADVIKIESRSGDPLRRCEPAAFATWNRAKRSVVLDLDTEDGRTALGRLVGEADVFVHGWTEREATELGLDDGTLGRLHPSLIVGTVTGYPAQHPDADRPACEILVQARIGAMDELEARRPGPMFVRFPFANWGAAYLLVSGIATRLFQRERTGRAQPVHTSLLQGAMTVASLYWQRAENPPDWMVAHTLPKVNNPGQLSIFECADGGFVQLLGAFTRSEPVAEVLTIRGEEDLLGVWVTAETRPRWVDVFKSLSRDEWTERLWAAGVVCMPVLDMGEVLETEQARVNGYAVSVDDPTFGPTVQAGLPFDVGRPVASIGGAPKLGADTTAVLEARHEPRRTQYRPAPGGSKKAFHGIRVLDFGSYVAGPFAGQCFADFGADVIKIEPCRGEKGRPINQFTGCHRGKRALALDLRHPSAGLVVERLLRSADVVMHNIRLSAAAKMGIDEAPVRAVNPDVIYAHSSAYGTTGPWADFGGFDPTAFAVSGWARELSPAGSPTWFRPSAMDCFTGISLFAAAAAGLYERQRTGRGVSVRTSLLAVAIAAAGETLLAGDERSAQPIVAVDADQTGISPFYRIYRAADGWFAVAASDPAERKMLAELLGMTDLATTDVATVVKSLEGGGVPVEAVATDNRDRFFDAELASGNRLVERTETLGYGGFESLGGYWSASADAGAGDGRATSTIRHPGTIPEIGEHTRAVLRDLDFADGEIDDFLRIGLIAEYGRPSD